MQKELIDYAMPLMEAERLLKDVYDHMLHNRPEEAMEAAKEVLTHMCDAMLMIKQDQLDTQ
jgi:hypothetical protein